MNTTGPVDAARDLTGAGTPESVWAAAGLPGRLPERDPGTLLPAGGRVVLLAPHPDDEVLGAGGLLAKLAARGARVDVVAASDGEASHPGRVDELRRVRALERTVALGRLGLGHADVHRLRRPDGRLDAADLADRLAPLVSPADVVLAPWRHDGHPDHDACGEAAALLPGKVWSYLVWAWHWATPAEIPWDRASRIALGDELTRAKRFATRAFASQLRGADPILPAHVLDRLLRSDEVLLEERP